ncbi:hypothetical protein ACIQPQ_31010 [Streptomyces sp. NPDC091281]|uniref:hypothetical protein n=1 Tax=Streptomyces sp. NPDC091281 TaxID=3365985 RepID=UPI0037FE5C71
MKVLYLTPREAALLLACVKGATRAEAGAEESIGPSQATNVINAAVAKLGARNIAHAFAIGLATGLFSIDQLSDLEVPQQALDTAAATGVEVPEATRQALERGRVEPAELEVRFPPLRNRRY